MKFGLNKMRGIALIYEQQALFLEGLSYEFIHYQINASNLFVLVVISIRSYNNELFQTRFI